VSLRQMEPGTGDIDYVALTQWISDELGPPFVGPYHLESKPGRRVTAVLEGTVNAPDVRAAIGSS